LRFVDRISFQLGRDNLLERIEELIKLTLDKLLELNATRGLITAETSELDVQIEELVMHLVFDRLNLTVAEIDSIIQHYVDDFLRKAPDSFLTKYKEKGFKDWFCKIESSRKWGIFRDLLKKIDGEDIKQFLSNNKTYKLEVIDVRNKFAHAKAVLKDGKQNLSGFGPEGELFEFDDTSCILIRKKLINHSDYFKNLFKTLGISRL
jgi:hypothetical protein